MTLLPSIKGELMRAAERLTNAAVVPSIKEELMRAATRLEAPPSVVVARDRSAPRRRARTTGAALALACGVIVVVLVALGGTDQTSVAASLPVLKGKKHDIRMLRRKLERLARNDATFTAARVIAAPLGTGYVVPTADGDGACIAVPLGDGTFSQSCMPMAEVRSQGLVVVADPADGRSGQVVAALPKGMTSATLTEPGRDVRTLTVSPVGIVAVAVTSGSRVDLTVDGRTRTVRVGLPPCVVEPTSGPLGRLTC